MARYLDELDGRPVEPSPDIIEGAIEDRTNGLFASADGDSVASADARNEGKGGSCSAAAEAKNAQPDSSTAS